jgi:hypothetical protein
VDGESVHFDLGEGISNKVSEYAKPNDSIVICGVVNNAVLATG